MGHVTDPPEFPLRGRVVRIPILEPVPGQLDIDGAPAALEPTLQHRFDEFQRKHPEVYDELVRLAQEWRDAGKTKCGIAMLFEVLRWQRGIFRYRGDDFKLNNDFRSRYVRLICERDPDLGAMFDQRELHA